MPMIGPICAPKSDAKSAPMPRPARSPPQRLMKLGFGGMAPGAVAGAGAVGAAVPAGVAGAAAALAGCAVGAARCLPMLLPPPKRLAASASIDIARSVSIVRARARRFFMEDFPDECIALLL